MRTLANIYQEYVVELDPILWEAGRINGIYVNEEARQQLLSEMNAKAKELKHSTLGMVPEELYPLHHYKTRPDQEMLDKLGALNLRTIEVPNEQVKTCSVCGQQHITKTEHTGRKGGRGDAPRNLCYRAAITLQPGIDKEYDAVLPFNPGSNDQLRQYAEKFHHKLGRNWKTGEDTLDEKQVQKFVNKYGDKHPIYKLAIEYGKLKTARTRYANAWVPDEKGLLYGYYTHSPATFRLAQKEHNFMNVSHKEDVPYATELRKLLVAPSGHMIVETDSSSVEAVMSAYFMGSPSYAAMAKRGIHALWACQSLGLEPTDANLKLVKSAKEHALLYARKKRTVHGTSYGMGGGLLAMNYPALFKNKLEAQMEIEDFYKFVPELKEWHTETQKWAAKHGYLENPWGLRNYYYRVFSFDFKSKTYKLGEDAKPCIAFKPQSSNGMFQRENIKLIDKGIRQRNKRGKWWMPAIGHNHDSNSLIVPEDDVYQAKELLEESMVRPIKEMGGLIVEAQTKAGKNWGEMAAI